MMRVFHVVEDVVRMLRLTGSSDPTQAKNCCRGMPTKTALPLLLEVRANFRVIARQARLLSCSPPAKNSTRTCRGESGVLVACVTRDAAIPDQPVTSADALG